MGEINFMVFYLIQYIQNITISNLQLMYKSINEVFPYYFLCYVFEIWCSFYTYTHFSVQSPTFQLTATSGYRGRGLLPKEGQGKRIEKLSGISWGTN